MQTAYGAKERYRSADVAGTYARSRFTSIAGRIRNRLEMRAFRSCIEAAGQIETALDVAGGTGRVANLLRDAGLSHPVVLDVSEEMLRRTTSGDPVLGDAEALPFADRTFDAVTSCRFLVHLPPDVRRRVMMEMARVSRRYVVVTYYHRRLLTRIRERVRPNRALHYVSWNDYQGDLRAASLRPVGRRRILPVPGTGDVVHILQLV